MIDAWTRKVTSEDVLDLVKMGSGIGEMRDVESNQWNEKASQVPS